MKGNKIFDFSRLGFQQIINTMTRKINECVDIANEMFPRLDEYISKVDWNKIINSDLYQKVLGELDKTNEQLDKTNEQLDNITSKWINKKFITFGDSITWQDGKNYSGSSVKAIGYQSLMKERFKFASYINAGVSGMPMTNMSGFTSTNQTIKSTSNIQDNDLYIIACGTNDFKLNANIGEIGLISDYDLNTNTFYGAYRDSIEYILSKNPNAKIVLFTPLPRDNGNYNSWSTVNSKGHKLVDYCNAIKKIGNMYGLPVVDLFEYSNFNIYNLPIYTRDGLHPNDDGYKVMGGIINSEIEKITLPLDRQLITEVSSVNIVEDSISMSDLETKTVTVDILPSNATNKFLKWKSSDENIAKVENGVITPLSDGCATIYAKSLNGFSDSCNITITTKPNLFVKETVNTDKYPDGNGGLSTYVGLSCSDYINVSAGSYTITPFTKMLCLYREDKTLISRDPNEYQGNYTFTVDDTCKYIRFAWFSDINESKYTAVDKIKVYKN